MTVARAIITLIETLPPQERQEVATWIKEHENTPLSQEEYLRRKNGLIKFAGALKDYQDYKPSDDDTFLVNVSTETIYSRETKEEGETWEKLFKNHRKNGKIQSV